MKASRRLRARDARKATSPEAGERKEEKEPTETADSKDGGPATVANPEPYATAWEHLSDELRRLDLLIACRMPEQEPGTSSAPLQQFKGLVLTEEEIRRLLGDPLDSSAAGQDAENPSTLRLQAALIDISAHIEARRTASLEAGVYLPLPYLARLFHLTPFEEQCLLICLAPELNRKYKGFMPTCRTT